MSTFRSILVGADFSERSQEAFRVASSLARANQARLTVVHVVERMPIAESTPADLQPGQVHHEAIVDRLRELYVPDRPFEVQYLTRDGVPAEELVRHARGQRCDLIVLGTHGRTGLRRLLAGSVAEAVLRHAPCPVLALRSNGRTALEPEPHTRVVTSL